MNATATLSEAPVSTDQLKAMLGRPPRVLVTKIGLDGHDRGSRLVAGFLRDAGMEVIYTAPWQAIETVVNQAMEEDVDVVGISSLATDHLLVPKLMDAMHAAKLDDVAVVVGGIVPDNEVPQLTDAGVAAVFHPGSSRQEIVATIANLIAERRAG
jgi:methylmalonyl-CoA mutase C-terminal domain/subunit